jgi:hypothetical protein
MAQQVDPPIIITGGSVTLEFDSSQLTPAGNGKHANPNKKIRRVKVQGDGIDFDQSVSNGKVTVTVYYDNGNT